MWRGFWLAGLACAVVGCGGSNAPTPVTPTSVVGVWDLVAADFTTGEHVTVSGVLSFQLAVDGTTLTIQQSGQTTTHGGPVTFGPNEMVITGPDIVGANVMSSTLNLIGALPTDCVHI